ncbi:MAG TPA: hypothetical protein VM452_09250 [Caulifigura sp.]|jgi:hypothetical protein|nr:hypothetical protein [Caulifigura sp.]
MHYPPHIDGRTVVVLSRAVLGYRIIESGILSYDGESLTLVGETSRRLFTDAELASVLDVTPDNRIPQCRGFDFLLFKEP